MITPIVRTKGGDFSLLFDVTEEELEVATLLRDFPTYVEAEARGVPLKPTTETSSSAWGARRIRTSVNKSSSQSPSTVPTPPPSVPSASVGTGVRDDKTNSSFPLSSSTYPPPTQSVPYTSGQPTVPLSQSSPSPQTQAVPSTPGRPSVTVEARTTSFPRNGDNDLNHNRLNKTAPVRKEIEKRKLELKKEAAINEFLKAKKQNLSSAIDGSKTSPEPSTVPQLGILKLLATRRSTIEGSKTPPEKATVPHFSIPKLYLHIRNGHDQRHEHVMGHQEPKESNPNTVIAGPETPWHSSEDGETMALAASIREIPNQKPSLSEFLIWNRKDSISVQAASGEARHDRMVTKKEEMNKEWQ
ncbi:hypothetical protein K2173_027885 [Erythroxylum novogranatense]|uniref:Uncharacterized protein n=1 Tax=Erythroxylum novogranatense TaxID=1862640 RepID=A0AAV8U0J2_9ROSI|nr:hypothetical protein K2173_027885 [Erythroxylum novogranatense]